MSAEVEKLVKQTRSIYNKADVPGALRFVRKALKDYPEAVQLKYIEAVFLAEDADKFGPTEMAKRYKKAAATLRRLLYSSRNLSPKERTQFRNEYYWFSRQPRKQYRLGVEMVKIGDKKSYYSQGVGACELAALYRKKDKPRLMLKWAKISERAWKNYFKVEPNWYNSYYFYARALGFQGRWDEMEDALRKSARIAKKPNNFREFEQVRKEFSAVLR